MDVKGPLMALVVGLDHTSIFYQLNQLLALFRFFYSKRSFSIR
jgi:hypothetical protein